MLSEQSPTFRPRLTKARRGMNVMELVMAAVLLTATLAGIARYQRQTVQSSQAAHRAALAQTRTTNLRREISTWPYEQVNVESIEKLPYQPSTCLPDARWRAQVEDVQEPIVGKRVTLKLEWMEGQQTYRGNPLTFWVKQP